MEFCSPPRRLVLSLTQPPSSLLPRPPPARVIRRIAMRKVYAHIFRCILTSLKRGRSVGPTDHPSVTLLSKSNQSTKFCVLIQFGWNMVCRLILEKKTITLKYSSHFQPISWFPTFLMQPLISLRGFVPGVILWSNGLSVGPSVRTAFVKSSRMEDLQCRNTDAH